MNWIIIVTLPLIVVVTYILTSRIRYYAITHQIIDVPNHRSSHSKPIPRGGGLAVVAIYLISLTTFHLVLNKVPLDWLSVICFGGLLIASVGWYDDRKSISVKIRIIVHLVAALSVIAMVGSEISLYVGPGVRLTSVLASAFTVSYIVWMINLYNFMDGIDGIASAQGVCVALIAAIWAYINGGQSLSLSYLLLSAVLLGFLLLNWHPAKIFMGDIGSGFIGFVFATLALWGESSGVMPWVPSIILMGVFIVDATFTLLKRLWHDQNIFEAHCSHTYQKMMRLGWSHKRVVWVFLFVNIFWLAPWSYISLMKPEWNWGSLICAYIPIVIAAAYFKAGTRDI